MKYLIKKDYRKRITVKNMELNNVILKATILNSNYFKFIYWNSSFKLTDVFEKISKTRIVDRCIVTGRKSKFNKFFRFSRIVFLRLSKLSLILGLKKSSW